MKTAGIDREMAMDATDLTQLSSREQLSALMDGALPADETRFLLRRLQHDASLAECWERWRLSAEVMRGLAPAQRLPVDFASRVAASLRGEENEKVELRTPAVSSSAWMRWGGGTAVAASLAAIAFMTLPGAVGSPGNLAGNTVVVAQSPASKVIAVSNTPSPTTPAPQAPAQDPAGAGLESQTAALASMVAVAAARPGRNNSRGSQRPAAQPTFTLTASNEAESADVGIAADSNIPPLMPQADIINRPWPRSVLPQYGNSGITVGFSEGTGSAAPYNPFQVRTGIGNLPPALIADPPARDATTPVNDETGRAAGSEPQS